MKTNGVGDSSAGATRGVDRKRTVILLRSVVIATCAYLVLRASDDLQLAPLAYVLLFATSNVFLAFVPRRFFYMEHFGPCLLLADTVVILLGMSWSHGLSQDLLLAYFFTVFLITIGETVGQVAIGSALVAAVYGYWLWISSGTTAEAWVRLPLFFLIAVFYASLIEQLKRERRRRQEAEDENQHLRLLLDLASMFSETHATREFVNGIGNFVEGSSPGLRCRMVLDDARAEAGRGTAFPVRAHGREYGALWVTSPRRTLSARERWLCQMVVHAAAGALYAAEQSDAARAAADAKDQFLATVSHEFRTPLHAILGYLDVLDTSLPDSDAGIQRESIERARVNACRLQHLLEELVSFAEIRSGQRAVRAEAVSLGEVIDELLPITRELLEGKSVSIICELDADIDALHTDRRKLSRALACLLSNAAKFTEAGEIRISARDGGSSLLEITITDSGIGIAPHDLAIIFDDFRQVDGSFTRRFGGLGIGLSLARELIALLGGGLELHSEVGVGTTVSLCLPRTVMTGIASVRAPQTWRLADLAPARAANS
jgi:signal transduction histidine kinase